MSDMCEFQSDCIEYKDISYLKIMPICAIHELSIACHDKENKCKYYQVYKQLKHTQNALQEIKTLVTTDYIQIKRQLVQNYDCLDNFMQKIEDKCGEVL